MDFGVVGLDNGCSISVTETNNMEKWYGSGGNKQERSGITTTTCEDDWRGLKVAKTVSDDYLSAASKSMLTTSLLRSEQGQQMLNFSSPNSQTFTTTSTLPYYHYPSSSSIPYTTRNPAGYGNGGLLISGARGPFTPSQWMELEHQALIYKYINANVPIPSYLLTPIRKALDSAGFSAFTSLGTNSFGWGGFHLGFSNSNDPEPGRCRRTDGKKWRCSRDAVADHKYCERHMNRGRHRSRKPVEGGQSGHSISGTTNNTNTVKLTSSSAAVVPGGGASNNPGLSSHHQLSNLQKIATSQSSAPPQGDRNLVDKEKLGERYQDTAGLSILSPAIRMKESDYSIPNPKQQNPYAESSRGEFGQVCSDSLLNPLNISSSFINCSTYGTSEDINDRESKSQHGLRQFMDDWPNSRTERSWPDIEMHSERTQLSISIPMSASDFMSSTSSPTNDKIATSPLRLSRELEMGLGVGNIANERNQRQANWIPIPWESSSLGGPLGEVLHSTNNNNRDGKNESALNLMSKGWDGCPSPRLASSPTGVLQKAALVSLSNSSAGSSPRAADNSRMIEGSSFCSGVFGSTLMNPSLNAL